jgi:hypothetical protein
MAAIRGSFTIERLEQVFAEFQDKGLLFVWQHEGKRYAHWTGSDVPGRLPPPSWRMRLEKFAPPVPKQQLAEYMGKFSRGRAALMGAEFGGEAARESFKIAAANGLNGGLEEAQAQDLDWILKENLKGKWGGGRERIGPGDAQEYAGDKSPGKEIKKNNFYKLNSSADANSKANALIGSISRQNTNANANANANSLSGAETVPGSQQADDNAERTSSAEPANLNLESHVQPRMDAGRTAVPYRWSEKELALQRELRVGAGPVCGPIPVKPEVLERIRQRDAARARQRSP